MAPRITKVFLGGNTAYGFYSFYDQASDPSARRLYVIKGGPGVGKSTFMRRIADEMIKLGHDAEFLCCSSDNDSYDGVRFPDLRIWLIDGTAPHVVDPKNPGAVDTIIHLGDYWDQNGIEQHKAEIVAINRETSRNFNRAYDYLAMAKRALDMLESYTSPAIDIRGLDRHAELLIADALGNDSRTKAGTLRSTFASAISPNGFVNYLDILLDEAPIRYIITGKPGSGRTTLIKRLAESAVRRGFDVEAYHCSLDPHKIEHLLIPELGVAASLSAYPHTLERKSADIVIDTGSFVDGKRLAKYAGEMAEAERLYADLLATGQRFIATAKRAHDEMEQYYVPYMDFDKVAEIRLKTLAEIVRLSEE